ncbi:MAG: trypsin-like peptidase domain-containing protein [Oligoflexia bacterium]|nr:trypsin-like peptidase domain-containing protein [Oligoflexia bacterium]
MKLFSKKHHLCYLHSMIMLSVLLITDLLLYPKNSYGNQEFFNNINEPNLIIGDENWIDLSNIYNSKKIQKNAQAVGYLKIYSKKRRCNAFLISRDIIMTNYHCIPDAETAKNTVFFPDFLQGTQRYDYLYTQPYLCEELLLSYKPLDITLLRCSGEPGASHAIALLEKPTQAPQAGERIYIIHQNCNTLEYSDCAATKKFSPGIIVEPKYLALEEDRFNIFYNADTLQGSSGAPVFSAKTHKVIALHHKGHRGYENNATNCLNCGESNSGIPMGIIIDFLRYYYPSLYNEIYP